MIDEKILQVLKQIKALAVGENFDKKLSACDIECLQPFLKRHGFEHLLFDILQKNAIEENELFEVAKQKKKKTVFKSILQQQAQENMTNALKRANVPYILLKGAVIKKLYVEPWMRISDDIDILVKLQDIKKAEQAAKSAGFIFNSRSTHDVSFVDENKIKIELHYDLIEDSCAQNANKVLLKVWDSAIQVKENEYRLTDEMTYFYHIAHLAKHFELGGCGVRAVLDTFLLSNINFDKEKREELLLKGGLDVFAKKVEALSKIWFLEDKNNDSDVDIMAEYIMRGGSFGSFSNFAQAKKSKEVQPFFSLLFPKKSDMEKLYPLVKKCALLLPVFWLVRIFKKIFKGNNTHSIKKIKSLNSENEQTKSVTEFFKNIGL